MGLMKCILPPPGTVNVQGPGFGRNFQNGDTVNFADKMPGSDQTWGTALADHAAAFEAADVKPALTVVEDTTDGE